MTKLKARRLFLGGHNFCHARFGAPDPDALCRFCMRGNCRVAPTSGHSDHNLSQKPQLALNSAFNSARLQFQSCVSLVSDAEERARDGL